VGPVGLHPGVLARAAARVEHAAVHQGEEPAQLVLLHVVDVVAGRHREVVGPAGDRPAAHRPRLAHRRLADVVDHRLVGTPRFARTDGGVARQPLDARRALAVGDLHVGQVQDAREADASQLTVGPVAAPEVVADDQRPAVVVGEPGVGRQLPRQDRALVGGALREGHHPAGPRPRLPLRPGREADRRARPRGRQHRAALQERAPAEVTHAHVPPLPCPRDPSVAGASVPRRPAGRRATSQPDSRATPGSRLCGSDRAGYVDIRQPAEPTLPSASAG
jgi:hypothetical protein